MCDTVRFVTGAMRNAALVFSYISPQHVNVRFATTRLFTQRSMKPAAPLDVHKISVDSTGTMVDRDSVSLPSRTI